MSGSTAAAGTSDFEIAPSRLQGWGWEAGGRLTEVGCPCMVTRRRVLGAPPLGTLGTRLTPSRARGEGAPSARVRAGQGGAGGTDGARASLDGRGGAAAHLPSKPCPAEPLGDPWSTQAAWAGAGVARAAPRTCKLCRRRVCPCSASARAAARIRTRSGDAIGRGSAAPQGAALCGAGTRYLGEPAAARRYRHSAAPPTRPADRCTPPGIDASLHCAVMRRPARLWRPSSARMRCCWRRLRRRSRPTRCGALATTATRPRGLSPPTRSRWAGSARPRRPSSRRGARPWTSRTGH